MKTKIPRQICTINVKINLNAIYYIKKLLKHISRYTLKVLLYTYCNFGNRVDDKLPKPYDL